MRSAPLPLRRASLAGVVAAAAVTPPLLHGTTAGGAAIAVATLFLAAALATLARPRFRRAAPLFVGLATAELIVVALVDSSLSPRVTAIAGIAVLGVAAVALTSPLPVARRRARAVVASATVAHPEPRQRHSFRPVVEGLAEVILVLEGDLTIRYVSPIVERLFGYVPDELIGAHLERLSGAHNRPLLEALRRAATRHGDGVEVQWELVDGTGRRRVAESTITSRLEERAQAYLLTMRDATERVALDHQLRNVAFHDPLTGLANRALFFERLAESLRRCHARGQHVGLLSVNLDGFRALNDHLGRPAGDYVLNVVGHRIADAIGPCHSVARSGADEFFVLLDGLEEEMELDTISDLIRTTVRAEISYDDAEHVVTASIGGSVSTEESTVDSLVGDASAAVFSAKRAGGDVYRQFVPAMRIEAMERFDVHADLRRALERSELELMYQPTFNVATGKVASFEALLRWHRPGHGLVGPEEFVSIADETGLLVDIGRWTLHSALAQLVAFSEVTDDDELAVEVNLSRNQIIDNSLVDDVRVALAASGIAPRRLILEISEEILGDRSIDMIGYLKQLRALGVRLAIEDFGTGYATISELQKMPIDMVKIDRSFIQGCTTDRGRGLLETIVRLGQTLSVTTVGEGAEEPRQLAVICELGCDMVQGYLLGRPISASEATLLVRRPEEDEASVSPFLSRWLQRHVVSETARALS